MLYLTQKSSFVVYKIHQLCFKDYITINDMQIAL